MKKLTLLAAPVIMLAANTTTAMAWGITPYVGVDAQMRHMDFDKGFGDNLFKKAYPQGNVFAGVKFNDYVGVEVGYETTQTETRRTTLGSGATVLGVTIPANTTLTTNASLRIDGPHANLVGFLPVFNEYNLELLAYVGVAHLRMNLDRSVVATNTGIVNPPGIGTFKKRKTVLRLGGGLQHKINNCWSVRALVGWENTKTTISQEEVVPVRQSVRLKDSLNYGVGVFYTFI